MRNELVKSAIVFLKDPQVANATVAKKVEFLESKGLTSEEVEEALRQANDGGGSNRSMLSSVPTPSDTIYPYPFSYAVSSPTSLPPPVPKRDWKDYFIMATVSVGVFYGIYEVSTRYVLPLILPSNPMAFEADKQALEDEFSRAEALLEQLHKDTEEIKESELQRKEQFSTVLQETQDAIEAVRGQSMQNGLEMNNIISEINTLKTSLPETLETNRDEQDRALMDIQEELRSLKLLLTNRMKSSISPVGPPPASVVPSFVGKGVPYKEVVLTEQETVQPSTQTQLPTQTQSQVPSLAQASEKQESSISQPSSSPNIPAWQLTASKSQSTST